MRAVGLRELKNRLSEYVRRVRAGESIVVTDRGEVVAELGPPGAGARDDAVPPGLATLAREGAVTLGAANDPALYPDLPPALRPGRAAELLEAERSGR